jgi:predicted HicB family RNase H-like nuclease
MTNTMAYQGYEARVTFDDANGIIAGRIAGIHDGVGFHADTVEGPRARFHEAVEDYLETCAAVGKDPQRIYFGRMMFRVNPEVHRKAALAGKSLNQWADEVLGKAAGCAR